MSLFSKFKSKKVAADISPDIESPPPLQNGTSELPGKDEIEPVYSEINLLRALYLEERTYPDVLEAVKPYIPNVQEVIKAHLDSIDAYHEWEHTIAEKQQAEASKASETPEVQETPEVSGITNASDITEVSETAENSETSEVSETAEDSEISVPTDTLTLEEEFPPPVPAADALVTVFSTADNMFGFLYCTAPIGDGRELDQELLETAVSDYGIKYGIIEEVYANILEKKDYNVIYLIAHGTAPVNGKDGQVKDHYQRNPEIHLEENERGVIDYKDLHLFHTITKGDVICDLIAPIEGQDGYDIMGKTIPAAIGNMPEIPQGKNTIVNEDNTALIADIDGDLSFQKNVFRVEPQLIISGNVDNSTGNIDFIGDVLVEGDVLRGYTVNAGSNIIILGMAEAAVLIAGEDIELRKGMNGNALGTLKAAGNIHSRFLEQTQVTARGDVVAETIINCQIVSGGNILATAGKGIIIGGTLAAQFSVEARRIGSLSNAKTVLKIGVPTQIEENIEYLSAQLQQSRDTLAKLDKNISFLNGFSSLPPDKAELCRVLKEQKQLQENIARDLQFKLNAVNGKEFDYSQCHVRGDTIYAITEVYMNYSKVCIRETTTMCNIYVSNDELVLGTF